MNGLKWLAMVSLFCFLLAGCATTPYVPDVSKLLLPNDINIVSPNPCLPSQIKLLSGTWGGRWSSPNAPADQGFDALLIIERVEKEQIQTVYAIGDCPSWRISRNFRRGLIPIVQKGETIILLFGGNLEIWFDCQKNIFKGRYTAGQYRSYITMSRMPR